MLSLPNEVELWTGGPLKAPENKLLVIGEGGTGDRITYSRWLPELDKLGIQWTYFPDANPPIPGLQSLMERVPWLAGKVSKMGDKYEASHWTTVFSLPAAFEAIPTKIPKFPQFFLPDPEIKKRYTINKPDDSSGLRTDLGSERTLRRGHEIPLTARIAGHETRALDCGQMPLGKLLDGRRAWE